MIDIAEQDVSNKIYNFMSRKAYQYPELNLMERWEQYEDTPHHRGLGETRKFFKRTKEALTW